MEPNENGFFGALNKMANCLIVNACWFAACLPIFTIGASTAAMYATIQRNILHDKGYPFPTFWKEFKRNFKSATIIWLAVLAVSAILIFDIRYFFQQASEGHGWGLFYLLLAVVLVLLLLTTLYTMGYVAKFETTRWRAFRSSFIIMLMHPFRNLLFLPVFYMLSFVQFLEKAFYNLMTDEEKAKEDERNRDYASLEKKEQNEK